MNLIITIILNTKAINNKITTIKITNTIKNIKVKILDLTIKININLTIFKTIINISSRTKKNSNNNLTILI